MRAKWCAAITLMLIGATGSAVAAEPAWQEPGFVMEELVVTAPRMEHSAAADSAFRARVAHRLRTLTADSLRLIRSADELRANVDQFSVAP